MKAMQLQEYKQLKIVDIPTPDIQPHELLIEVKACGICGSDIHGYDGSTGRRVPPLVMGHEAAGVVSKAGGKVTKFSVGDRVTFDSTISCGHCNNCRRGQINLCANRQILGVSCNEFKRNGAFAEFVVVPENIVYALPDSLSFEHAALIEAVSIAVHATNRTPKQLGQTAVVVGTGMIGLLCIQTIKLAGFADVIAVDLDDEKLKKAAALGATATLNAKNVNVAEEVKKLTGGEGSDVTLEVVGATATIQSAIACTRRGGAVTLVGNLAPKIEFPLQSVVTGELSIFGSCASSGEIPQCIKLLDSGAVDVRPLITATATLDEGPKWFERLYAGEAGAMKVVLMPN